MDVIEFHWLHDEPNLKQALQVLLQCSGQLLKKHFSSKQLSAPVRAKSFSKLPLDLVNHLQINPVYSGPEARLIAVRENYLVVHKPAGVHSHPLCYSDQDTLLNFLASQNIWDALKVNEANYDRGLLYRLDYETSGIMLVARNEEYFQLIRASFREAMKRKLYWVIVEGDFNREGHWTHYFRASGVKGSKQKVEEHSHADADEGELEVRKLLFHNGKSLLAVNLKSGLRHQIRSQLAHLGFPILGDELYGGAKAERLFLHALRYEWDEVETDLSADLFGSFFDLDRGLEMTNNMFGLLKRS